MVTIRTRLNRAGLLFGLIALLASGAAFEPSHAFAKPFNAGGPGGEPNGSGDPTGDDQPSPTPKPTSHAAKWGGDGSASGTAALDRRNGGFGSLSRWNAYFRLLIRLGLR